MMALFVLLILLILPGGIANRQFHVGSTCDAVALSVPGPISSYHPDLNCYFFNACSILNKLPDLEILLHLNSPVFVGICETHAYAEIPDELICPIGYSIIRKDRNKFGGGVTLLIRNDVTFSKVITCVDYKDVEVCCVDLTFNNNNFRIIVYYRPPYYTPAAEQYFDLSLRCLSSLMHNARSQIILMGDFNLPNVDWVHYSAPANFFYDKFIRFVNECGLLQFVLEPTRRENILDLVMTNVPNLISDLQVQCPFSTSDHNVISFTLNITCDNSDVLDNQSIDYLYHDFSSADYEAMELYLSNVNWSLEFTFVFSVEDYWQIFAHHLNTAIESYVPVRKKPEHINSKKKSYPKRIRKMLSRKAHYWRRWRLTKKIEHKLAYKAYSVKCVKAIQAHYRDLETALVQSDNLGKFYRYVNGKISGRKSIPPIKDDTGNLVTNKVAQANIFNRYFASVFTCDDGNKPHFSSRVDCNSKCYDVNFTPLKVKRVLKALKSKNSYGPDGFPNLLVKMLADVICEPLAFIFQASFRSHILPAYWLHAFVTPVFKKGLTSDPGNYRPISLTCVCCRVMERIINLELLNYLSQHGLISKYQHGFLRKHSTCSNLLESVHDWSVALNNKYTTDIVYVDFQKAFDSVSHQKLITKLEGYGICGDLLEWLKAFLSNRTQVVNISGHVSENVYITSGVPQGSVLGPTLFLLFINDIDDILFGTSVRMKLYADDVKLYSSFTQTSCDLQAVCDRLQTWAEKWQLQTSYDKCSVQRITNRVSIADCNPSYKIGSHVLCWSDETRDLGVIIDKKLNFNSHVSAIAHKAHVRASLILRTFVTRDPTVLTKAFITYVRPLLEYCTPVWSPHTITNIIKIESCQRWFTKRINGLFGMQYSERLACLGLESLEVRRLKCDLVMCYKVAHNQITILNDDFFVFSDCVRNRGHCYKLFKSCSLVNAHKYFFTNRICDIWNGLPSTVVEASSLSVFKRRLDCVDLSKYCIF